MVGASLPAPTYIDLTLFVVILRFGKIDLYQFVIKRQIHKMVNQEAYKLFDLIKKLNDTK